MEGIELDGVFSYSLRFKAPLKIGGQSLAARDGLVIRVIRPDGSAGLGEVAPLPGYSLETLSQAKEQLDQLKDLSPNELFPSVAFGIETALIKSFARSGDSPMSQTSSHTIIGSTRRVAGGIRVNALLIPDMGRVEEQVGELVEAGFGTIKVKVGRGSVDEDIEIVNRVLGCVPAGVKLRLDANRLWDIGQGLRFGRGVAGLGKGVIEYIEEPLAGLSGVTDFYRGTGLPVALDESLFGLAPVWGNLPEGVSALVLKPAMTGGIGKTMSWIQLARSHGLTPVISSCFEAGPGFAVLVKLAASIGGGEVASGLDTLKYLEEDLFARPIEIIEGKIGADIDESYDFTKLTAHPLTVGGG